MRCAHQLWETTASDRSVTAGPGDVVVTMALPGDPQVEVTATVHDPEDESPGGDLDLIYRWVTDEHAAFWQMGGLSRDEVQEIFRELAAAPRHHGFVVRLSGEPCGFFQVYHPEADVLGEHITVEEGDLGIHVLMAPTDTPRPGLTSHLLFLALQVSFSDPACQRILAEPDASNVKAIDRFLELGAHDMGLVTLPTKTARLIAVPRPS